jgi:hypothetical protein
LLDGTEARARLDRVEGVVPADVVARDEQLERVAPLAKQRKGVLPDVLVDAVEGDDGVPWIRGVVLVQRHDVVGCKRRHLSLERGHRDPPGRRRLECDLVIEEDHFSWTSMRCVCSR